MHTPDHIRTRLTRLGDATRAAEQMLEDARNNRDAEIEQANLQGLSVREIATATGMSTARVQRVIIERAAARQARLRQGVPA